MNVRDCKTEAEVRDVLMARGVCDECTIQIVLDRTACERESRKSYYLSQARELASVEQLVRACFPDTEISPGELALYVDYVLWTAVYFDIRLDIKPEKNRPSRVAEPQADVLLGLSLRYTSSRLSNIGLSESLETSAFLRSRRFPIGTPKGVSSLPILEADADGAIFYELPPTFAVNGWGVRRVRVDALTPIPMLRLIAEHGIAARCNLLQKGEESPFVRRGEIRYWSEMYDYASKALGSIVDGEDGRVFTGRWFQGDCKDPVRDNFSRGLEAYAERMRSLFQATDISHNVEQIVWLGLPAHREDAA